MFATSVSQSDNSSELNMEPMSLEFINSLWVPNIFIYNLKTYKVISVLSKLAGLWIDEKKKVLYRHGSLINLHNFITAETTYPSLFEYFERGQRLYWDGVRCLWLNNVSTFLSLLLPRRNFKSKQFIMLWGRGSKSDKK